MSMTWMPLSASPRLSASCSAGPEMRPSRPVRTRSWPMARGLGGKAPPYAVNHLRVEVLIDYAADVVSAENSRIQH